jgi:hypothetical protein
MENHRILKYNVDGYDSETKTVYEFYGCFFHGCPRCCNKDAYNPLARKLMSKLYDYTIKTIKIQTWTNHRHHERQ